MGGGFCQAFAVITSIVPWNADYGNDAISFPQFTILEISQLSQPLLYIMAIIAIAFTFGTLLISKTKQESSTRWEAFLGGYLLPPIGSILFLIITNVLLSAFSCQPDLSNVVGIAPGKFYLASAWQEVECFTAPHFALMIIAGVSLLVYYPVAVIAMPVR